MKKVWESANVRASLSERIRETIQKRTDPTITNLNQFIDLALREKLEKLEASKK